MNKTKYLHLLKSIGMVPSFLSKTDSIKIFYWLSVKKGERKMYYCQFQQALIGIALFVWERKNHRYVYKSMKKCKNS